MSAGPFAYLRRPTIDRTRGMVPFRKAKYSIPSPPGPLDGCGRWPSLVYTVSFDIQGDP